MHKLQACILAVTAAAFANIPGAMAAPLPNGTKLGITEGVITPTTTNVPCSVGSCYGLEISPGYYIWQGIAPGTDGGFIVGKSQKCVTSVPGVIPDVIPGELATAPNFPNMVSVPSFCTDPGGELNLFSDATCTTVGCLGKTELKNFYVADSAGNKISLSNNGAVLDYRVYPVIGGNWSLDYSSVIAAGPTQNVGFRLLMRGPVLPSGIGALPAGTLLTIDPGDYNFEGNCGSVGSCLSIWHGSQFLTGVPLSAGTDGGIVIGKNQLPGGQQIYSPVDPATPGELSAASQYLGRNATVATAPFSGLDEMGLVTTVSTDASRNIFERGSCWQDACLGRTVLGSWHLAMGGYAVPLGSAEGCRSVKCQSYQLAGIGVRSWTVFPDGRYELRYDWVIPDDHPYIFLAGIPISLHLTGKIVLPVNAPPTAADVNIIAESAQATNWSPVVNDSNGDPVVCRIGVPPANGTATIDSNCASGGYQSNPGFIGVDSFTYLANDGQADSNSATVTVAVTEPPPSDPCLAQYPVSQFTQTGKEGTITLRFSGNIVSHTNKVVKLCPGTTLKYQASSTQGPVVCQVKNNTTRDSGMLKINDHLKCTDKPAGQDKVHFKVKSGVK